MFHSAFTSWTFLRRPIVFVVGFLWLLGIKLLSHMKVTMSMWPLVLKDACVISLHTEMWSFVDNRPLASTSSEPIFLEFTLAQNLASMENYMNPRVLFQRTMILYDLHGSERGWITIHTLAVSEAELSRCTWGGDGVDSDKMTKRFWHGMVFCRCHRWLYHVRPYSSDHTFLDFWERCFELNRRGLIMSDRFLRVASPCGSKVDGAHKLRD